MANTHKAVSFVKLDFYQFMLLSLDYRYFEHLTVCSFKEVDSEMREARGLPEILPSLLWSSLKKEMTKRQFCVWYLYPA